MPMGYYLLVYYVLINMTSPIPIVVIFNAQCITKYKYYANIITFLIEHCNYILINIPCINEIETIIIYQLTNYNITYNLL